MQKRKKKAGRLVTSIVLILLAAGYATWAYMQPLLTIKPLAAPPLPEQKSSTVALDWPSYGQAAIGAAGYGVLATNGDQTPLPTASIAKVITALVVLRQRPLQLNEQGPTLTLTQADVDSYNSYVAKNGSVVGVGLGERISEYQALQALLLPSANNMADTLARWAFGSLEAYGAYANDFADGLGLKTVHITDPSGYDPTTVASAHDLTVLGSLAMLNPVIAEIVAQPSATIPVQGTISNYNAVLGQKGNIGIKTGNNDGDRGAFLFANKQKVGDQDVTIVGTIMGGPDLGTVLKDSEPLIQSATKQFTSTTFVTAGQKVGSYTAPGQGTVDAVAAEDLRFVTWNGHSFTTSTSLQPLHGATSTSTSVGTVTVTDTTSHITTTARVVLAKPIAAPTLLWRLTHPF